MLTCLPILVSFPLISCSQSCSHLPLPLHMCFTLTTLSLHYHTSMSLTNPSITTIFFVIFNTTITASTFNAFTSYSSSLLPFPIIPPHHHGCGMLQRRKKWKRRARNIHQEPDHGVHHSSVLPPKSSHCPRSPVFLFSPTQTGMCVCPRFGAHTTQPTPQKGPKHYKCFLFP